MTMRTDLTLGLLLGLATPLCAQITNATYTAEKDQVSYAIGYNIGMNLQRQDYVVDPDIIARGIRDILEGKTPAMSENDARQVLQQYQQQLFKKKQEEQAAQAAKNKEQGAAWLAENAKQEGVVTLESGLQYKVLASGTGESPAATDTVKVHYRGTLIDGTEFDSSFSRGQPAQFKVNGVIPGWTEALQKMRRATNGSCSFPRTWPMATVSRATRSNPVPP
jgi:FKBP-type peptidyl-prolyl cis-trans isomerase FklB